MSEQTKETPAPAHTKQAPPSPSSTTWTRLRAWIDEQENWERAHNKPVQLTDAQHQAINALISDHRDSELEDRNFISELLECCQSRKLQLPNFEFEAIMAPSKTSRWRAVCIIPGLDERFPRTGWGLQTGEDAPAFQGKKRAKQFAAKYALEFLKSRPASPTILPPTPKRTKLVKDSSSAQDQPGSEAVVSIFQKVVTLASKLKIESPSYEIVTDDAAGDAQDVWNGRPLFQPNARIPPGLGVVSGVVGRKRAKAEVAEKVFEWLQAEEQKRDEMHDRIMKSLAAGTILQRQLSHSRQQ